MKTIAKSLFVCQLLLASSTISALADQIDGKWCSPDGESMTINFSDVTTPAGNQITANYNRHHVDYVAPSGEKNEGATISADQINDDQIRVTIIGTDRKSASVWTKCQGVTS